MPDSGDGIHPLHVGDPAEITVHRVQPGLLAWLDGQLSEDGLLRPLQRVSSDIEN